MINRAGLVASLTLCCILASACGGGGGSKVFPTITAVTPSGVVGITGTTVTFQVNVGNLVAPTTYSWNFGTGATPATSTEVSPTVTLSDTGSYLGSVTVCNPDGCDDPFPFNFTVSAPTEPPVISAVAPTAAFTGETAEFSLVATNAPTSFSWNFGGGAMPNTSTEARPNVLVENAGTFMGTVTASNIAGTSAPFNFTFEVMDPTAVPTITAVNPSGTAGASGQTVTFSATADQGPTSFAWDFGGAATPNLSSAAKPVVQLGSPGTYNGTVTATNALGDSSPFAFTITVSTPSTPNWTDHPVDSMANSAVWGYDMELIGDRYFIAYREEASGSLAIAKANNANPTAESQWTRYTIAPASGTVDGFDPTIAVVAGRICIAHIQVDAGTSSNPMILFTRATVADPNVASQWSTTAAVSEQVGGIELNVLMDDRPALTFSGPLNRPRVAIAENSNPTGLGQWQKHFPTSAAFTDPVDSTVRNNRLAFVVGGLNGLRVFQATTDFPTASGSWTDHTPVSGLANVRDARIVSLNNRLVVVYGDNAAESSANLEIALAQVATPAGTGDWLRYEIGTAARSGIGNEVEVLGGRLAIAHFRAVTAGVLYELRVARALNAMPANASEWQIDPVDQDPGLLSARPALTSSNGRIGVIVGVDPAAKLTMYQAGSAW